jgi:hypothetical protein
LRKLPGQKNADAMMASHHGVAAVDPGIVETGPVEAGLQIVRRDLAGGAAEERPPLTSLRFVPHGRRSLAQRLSTMGTPDGTLYFQ